MTIPNPFGLPEPMNALAANSLGAVTAGAAANGQVFMQGLSGAGPVPILAAGTGAGSGASAGGQKGHDLGGSFVLTTAGTPAAGTLATVTFGTPLSASPAAVTVTCWDQTSNTAVAVGYSATATGFSVLGPATTTAHNLLVTYQVVVN